MFLLGRSEKDGAEAEVEMWCHYRNSRLILWGALELGWRFRGESQWGSRLSYALVGQSLNVICPWAKGNSGWGSCFQTRADSREALTWELWATYYPSSWGQEKEHQCFSPKVAWGTANLGVYRAGTVYSIKFRKYKKCKKKNKSGSWCYCSAWTVFCILVYFLPSFFLGICSSYRFETTSKTPFHTLLHPLTWFT